MSKINKKMISAQVILVPEAGEGLLSAETITSENVHLMMPSAENVEQTRTHFEKLGFEVQPGFANSFSISGDVKLFEKTFEAKFSMDETLGVKVQHSNDEETYELPLDNISDEIKKLVETVTFSEPPDFGPGNF